MFVFNQETDVDFSLQYLQIYRAWHAQTRNRLGGELSTDGLFENVWDLLEPFGDMSINYDEAACVEIWRINAACIRDYYRLCHALGRIHHIRFWNNPYVIRAEKYVRSRILPGESCWLLQPAMRKRYPVGLYVWIDLNDYGAADVPLIVVDILLWYQRAVRELRIAWERSEA